MPSMFASSIRTASTPYYKKKAQSCIKRVSAGDWKFFDRLHHINFLLLANYTERGRLCSSWLSINLPATTDIIRYMSSSAFCVWDKPITRKCQLRVHKRQQPDVIKISRRKWDKLQCISSSSLMYNNAKKKNRKRIWIISCWLRDFTS